MGQETGGLVPFLDGGQLWAAAIVFAFAVGIALLFWKRARHRGKVALRHQPVTGGTAGGIAVEPVRSTSAHDTLRLAPGEDEDGGRSGTVLVELAPEEVQHTARGAESSVISQGDSGEAGAPVESPAGGSAEALPDSAVLAPPFETVPAETIPAAADAVSNEETNLADSMTSPGDLGKALAAGIAETGQASEENRSEVPGDSESEELAEPIAEKQGLVEWVEQGSDTEEDEERTDAGRSREEEAPAEESEAAGVEAEEGTEDESAPARYRAPGLGPGKAQRRKSARPGATNQNNVLEMRIRAISDRHGFCRFQVVGRRPDGAPEELEARGGRRTVVLSEVADDWYQVGDLNDLPSVMERGCKFSASYVEGEEITWELRGRDLYVLAELHGLFGFVSTPRLSIGEKQIVICRKGRAAEVQAIMAGAGCDGLQVYGEDHGAPAGWVFFRPVNPCRSIPQAPGDDILNVIRPIPDVEVRLEGGLWLRNSCWIVGYPPRVRVVGEMPPGTEATIDGEKATEREQGIYVTGSSERVGSHIVWCAGKSARYEICEWDVHWEEWQADGFARCVFGAAVAQSGNACETLVNVPTSNPVLIGANPGEVFRCDARTGKQWSGLVPFPVCWALPEDALHCDRSVRRVLLVTPIPPVPAKAPTHWNKRQRASALLWCQAIRDCQQKRLALMPADEASEDLWREYKGEARAVWRTARRA